MINVNVANQVVPDWWIYYNCVHRSLGQTI